LHSTKLQQVILGGLNFSWSLLTLRLNACLPQVLCNAAKADKARLQQLEVEVARLSHRADIAEQECQGLREKLNKAEVYPMLTQCKAAASWLAFSVRLSCSIPFVTRGVLLVCVGSKGSVSKTPHTP
jgi:hypothetical protein